MLAKDVKHIPEPDLLYHDPLPLGFIGLAPRRVLGVEWWLDERVRWRSKFEDACWACGDPTVPLEGHETYEFDYKKHTGLYAGTAMLCPLCHQFIHRNILVARYYKSQVAQRTLNEVWIHAYPLIKSNPLRIVSRPWLNAFHAFQQALDDAEDVFFEVERKVCVVDSFAFWTLILEYTHNDILQEVTIEPLKGLIALIQ